MQITKELLEACNEIAPECAQCPFGVNLGCFFGNNGSVHYVIHYDGETQHYICYKRAKIIMQIEKEMFNIEKDYEDAGTKFYKIHRQDFVRRENTDNKKSQEKSD